MSRNAKDYDRLLGLNTAQRQRPRFSEDVLKVTPVERLKVAVRDQEISLKLAVGDDLSWVRHFSAHLKICWAKKTQEIACKVSLYTTTATPTDLADAHRLAHSLVGQLTGASVQTQLERVALDLQLFWDGYKASLTAAQAQLVKQDLMDGLKVGIQLLAGSATSCNPLDWLSSRSRDLLAQVDAQRASSLLKLKDYAQVFPLARSIRREFELRLGPTNSGKTHGALQAMMSAPSGVYLAPLRLLAIEIRDRLMAQGVPCSLITGEEKILVEGAKHVASTIEMLNPEVLYDVAVIDEIQMLSDDSRGWAWTAAVVGVAAQKVFLCGAATAEAACQGLLDHTQDPFEVVHLERMSPLMVKQVSTDKKGKSRNRSKKRSSLDVLQPGDALIAFSRKDVLTLSAQCRELGYTVACIYGALAPEVRRREAERFATGEAQVIVATDAIGMGLNLPISRVVFSTLEKFDGKVRRELLPAEAQQIAGRAGRYGISDNGIATVMPGENLGLLERLLAAPQPLVPKMCKVAPTLSQLQALAELLSTQKISALLSFFAKSLAADGKLFSPAPLDDSILLGSHVDSMLVPTRTLSLEEKFVFACAPASVEKAEELAYFSKCLKARAHGQELGLPPEPSWLNQKVSAYRLSDAETLNKHVSLYAWLSMKYPDTFVDAQGVPALRAKLSDYIEQALLAQTVAHVTMPTDSMKKHLR